MHPEHGEHQAQVIIQRAFARAQHVGSYYTRAALNKLRYDPHLQVCEAVPAEWIVSLVHVRAGLG